MASFSHTVEIPRPPAEVFPWLLEEDKVPQWTGNLRALRAARRGALGTGSRVRQVLEVSGRRIDVELEITAYEPPTGAETRFSTNGIEVVNAYALEAAGAGTRLTQSVDAKPSGLTARMLVPVIQPRLEEKLTQDLERLRESCRASASRASLVAASRAARRRARGGGAGRARRARVEALQSDQRLRRPGAEALDGVDADELREPRSPTAGVRRSTSRSCPRARATAEDARPRARATRVGEAGAYAVVVAGPARAPGRAPRRATRRDAAFEAHAGEGAEIVLRDFVDRARRRATTAAAAAAPAR